MSAPEMRAPPGDAEEPADLGRLAALLQRQHETVRSALPRVLERSGTARDAAFATAYQRFCEDPLALAVEVGGSRVEGETFSEMLDDARRQIRGEGPLDAGSRV